MSAKMNVPHLRFSEFSEEWEEKRLELVTEKIQDGTHFSPNVLEDGAYKYITSKNIRNGYMDFTLLDYISEEEHNKIYKRCSVKYGDVLLTKDGASTGNVCLNTLNEEFSLLSSVAFIRANDTYATNNFIYQYITSARGQYLIRSSMAGQAITRITLTKLKEFKFFYPSKQEQEKIASFLSSVDTKIEQLTAKTKLLQEYKKGVMQKIFSQEIRFKDDESDYPEWVEKKLEEVVKITRGKNISSSKLGKYYLLGMGSVTKKGKLAVSNKTEHSDNFVNKNDLIMPERDIGVGLIIDKDKSYILGANLLKLEVYKTELSKFLYFLINSNLFNKKIKRLVNGSAQLMITSKDIKKLNIALPSLKEQTKIANFLSSIDSKIEQTQKQLDSTKEFKKALLQQMFV